MIVRSAFDVVDFETGPEQRTVFAWLCAERAAGVWRLDGGSVGDQIQEALAAMGSRYGASTGAPSAIRLRDMHEAILGVLDPDSDFGRLHAFRVHAVSSVAHALAAAIADGDEQAASQESAQSAQAEISMVKGAYYRRTGTYTGVYEHPSFVRQIQWQSDDLASLRPDSAAEVEQLRSRAVEHGLLLADEILDDRLF